VLGVNRWVYGTVVAMKISSQELQVLAAINTLGAAPIQKLAECTRLKPHTVRYALQALIDREAIEPVSAINVQALGLRSYVVYFSIKAASTAAEERAAQVAAAHQNVSWVAELSGDYQFGLEVLAPSVPVALKIIGEIRDQMGVTWFRKAFVEGLELYVWPLKYFAKGELAANTICYRPTDNIHVMDRFDHQILRTKAEEPNASDAVIARRCGAPTNTVTYRIKRMEDAGVITGYCYTPRWDKLKLVQYKIVVTLKVIDSVAHAALLAFARRADHCIFALACVGAWDFEFNIFTSSADEGRAFTALLWREFGESLDSVNIISYPRTIKRVEYPFEDESALFLKRL
jgi:DNA-binding Lrp family transcriptional regulator